jgi:2,3-bisphosphoglycerate-dependent phosphoglycerate mutase
MVEVWLIRHGESEANAGLPTSDHGSVKLTERGHRQAEKIVKSFNQPPSLIVTSPYIRTKQTAKPTIEHFASVPQTEWLVQEFSLLSVERCHNKTDQESRPLRQAYWKNADPLYVDGAGAESFANLIRRAQDLREKINQLDDGFIAIFTHSWFMRVFLWLLLTNPVGVTSETMHQVRAFFDSMKAPNGGIIKLKLKNPDIWFCGVVTSHLAE